MYSRLLVALAALVLAPSQVNAKWYEAKSRHFIVYSEQKPHDLRAYASKLERYDSAIRAARKMKDPTNAPCQKVLMPSRIRLLRITSISRAPTTAPNAVPTPPARLAPPITAAAMTDNSIA